MLESEDGPFTELSASSSYEGRKSEVAPSTFTGEEFPLNKEKKTLLNIFSNFNVIELSKVARVCKAWKEASEQETLWKKFLPSTLQNSTLPEGISWKRLYLNKRNEFLSTCKKSGGLFLRLDNDVFTASSGGNISGEVILALEKDDRLFGPVSVRFIGYEESFENHAVLCEVNRDVENGAYPMELVKGIHTFPFSIKLPQRDETGNWLPPSVHYAWEDYLVDDETFSIEYLVVAKLQTSNNNVLKKSKAITMLPSFDSNEKYSKIRFCNTENVYTSRFPFANVKFRASLQSHPQVTEEHVTFEVSVEVENFNTNVSGPVTVKLYHTAASEEYVPPELHVKRLEKEYPMQFPKSLANDPPQKRTVSFTVPQRELWIEKIRGPPPAIANLVSSLLVSLRVSIFTTISVNLPIEFLRGAETNNVTTEKEQDLGRPVVQLE